MFGTELIHYMHGTSIRGAMKPVGVDLFGFQHVLKPHWY